MTTMKQDLIISGFTLLPYSLAAWGFTALTDGESSTFWKSLLVLFVLRVFFYLIDTISDLLRWRLWARKLTIAHALGWFTARQFPQRQYADDDMDNYLARIETDNGQPTVLRMAAAELNQLLLTYEQFGILVGRRFRDAYQLAFEQYAPASRAIRRSMFDEPISTKEGNVG